MKTGRTLQALAAEIQRQADAKRDYIVPHSKLRMTPDAQLAIEGVSDGLDINEHAHGQLAGHLDIPKRYYDRLRGSSKAVLCGNVNHWLEAAPETRRMVRTLDNGARALLSDRYHRIDNEDVSNVALQALLEDAPETGMEVASCEVTDTKLYIKAVFPRIEREVKRGDVVQAGVMITNSEVGSGALNVSPFVLRLICTNGMVSATKLRRNHVGRRADESEFAFELLSDEARAADDKAILLKVRDVIRASVKPEVFEATVDRLAESMGEKIERNVVDTVELLAKRRGFNTEEKDSVLRHLIEGGDLSRFGLVQAVTRTAQDLPSYDRATEFEALGGQILELPRSEWRELVAA